MKNFFILVALTVSYTLSAQVPPYVPQNGLMGYWPFSGNANDAIGGNNGTVFGATLCPDRFNIPANAYSFNGSTNYISTNYTGILGSNPRAVSFWTRTSISQVAMSAVAWGSMGTASRYECGFNYGAPGPMIDGGNGAITYSATTAFSDNLWHHYVIQFGSSSALNLVQIFYDNVLLTTPSNVYNGANILNTIGTSGFPVQFGRLPNAHYFDGAIDDIGIWNRPLTLCEINTLFYSNTLSVAVSGNTTICAGSSGGSATLTPNSVTGPFSYVWTPAVSTGSVAGGLGVGSYTYQVSNSKSCMFSGSFYIGSISCTDLISHSDHEKETQLFQDPGSQLFYLQNLQPGTLVKIYSSLGQLVLEQKSVDGNLTIDLSDQAIDVYLVKINTQQGTSFKRLIKH